MSGSNATDVRPESAIFRLATIPARLLGRYRRDLRASLAVDSIRYSGGAAARFFAVLAVMAVGYPVVASIVHTLSAPTVTGDPLTLALRPFFEDVYSESLPFMVAVAGIGAFSPALGVLLILVFIPADLIAAWNSYAELVKLGWQTYPEPIFARFISYGLLWILAVEIPIRARSWASGLAARAPRSPSVVAFVALIGSTALLVFFWARALPWLIQPVFDWSAMQLVTPQASAPTWFFWHFLVIAAVVIAAVAAVWPPPAWSALAPAQPMPDPPGQRSMLAVLTRQTLAMLVLAALLAGLMTGLREAAILVAGLLVAGPVLTLILPYVPAPAVVARAPFAVRWVAAMTIALIVSVLIESLAGDALGDTYLVIVVTLAVVAPLFRVILEAGSTPRAADAHPTRHAPPPAVVNSALLVLALTLWLALPAAALAHNCPSRAAGEDKVCVKYNFDAVPALIGGALAAAGGAMWSGLRRLEQEDRDRAKTFWNMFFWWGPDWSKVNRKTEKDLPPWTPDSRRDYDPDDPLPR